MHILKLYNRSGWCINHRKLSNLVHFDPPKAPPGEEPSREAQSALTWRRRASERPIPSYK